MSPNELFTGLSVILAGLSIIVSVIGWTITYRRQKEILERQIAAEADKEKASVLLSMTINELEKIRAWVNKGFEISRFHIKTSHDRAQLIEKEKVWVEEYTEISHLANYLDRRSKTTKMRSEDDTLSNFLHTFVRGISNSFKTEVLGEPLGKFFTFIDADIDDGFNALDRIDILMLESLGQPIPSYDLINYRDLAEME